LLEINFVFIGRQIWVIFTYTNIFGHFLNNIEVVISSINVISLTPMLSILHQENTSLNDYWSREYSSIQHL